MKKNKILLMSVVMAIFSISFIACNEDETPLIESHNTIAFDMDKTQLNNTLSNYLGYDNLTIKEGKYTIEHCNENFGTVFFNIETPQKIRKVKKYDGGLGIRIRIGSRKKNCLKGIGFRCGFVKIRLKEKQYFDNDRDKLADIIVDEENKTIMLKFLEPVDWEKLKTENPYSL